MDARSRSLRIQKRNRPTRVGQAGPADNRMSESLVARDRVTALGRARHLFRGEPTAIGRAHVDEPRIMRRRMHRRMVADRRDAALHVDRGGSDLELALEWIDRNTRV